MFDRFSIRAKLIAIVVGPLVLLLVLAVASGSQRRAEAGTARADAARIQLSRAAGDARQAVQLETFTVAQFLASDGKSGRTEMLAQFKATDAAVADLGEAVKAAPAADAAIGASAARQLEFGEAIRSQVLSRTISWYQAAQIYRGREATISQVSLTLVDRVEDPVLAAELRSLAGLSAFKGARAEVATILAGAFAQGAFRVGAGEVLREGAQSTIATETPRQDLIDALADAEVQRTVFTSAATPELRRAIRNDVGGDALNRFDVAAEAAKGVSDTDPLRTDPGQWAEDATTVLTSLRRIEQRASDDLVDSARDRASAAEWAARLFLAGALLAVGLVLALAVAVATSITRPLDRLTRAADRLASVQLPRLVTGLRSPEESDVAHLAAEVEPVSAEGGREIGRLATSVNSIQHVAVEVATEQAALLRKGIGDMFVNLARRNQALLDRQLEFIDELEAEEEDPDQLENLFRLDHMSTRMRRNAESLLVLAGAEPTRRRGRPLPLADVVRAAVGEVEDFTRIDLLDLDEVLVSSGAGPDVAHLLSELMENATHFSPPDTRIEVVGHRSSADGYVVSITDEGIGMADDQLKAANELLARPPLVGLTLSRTLGFIVVARLAERYEISVRLLPSPAGGVTAVVALPSSVIAPSPATVDLADSPGADAPSASEPARDDEATVASALDDELDQTVDRTLEPGPVVPGAPATLAEAMADGAVVDAAMDEIMGRPVNEGAPLVRRTAAGPRQGTRGDGPPRVDGLPTRRPMATAGRAVPSTMPEPLLGRTASEGQGARTASEGQGAGDGVVPARHTGDPAKTVSAHAGPEPLVGTDPLPTRAPLFASPSERLDPVIRADGSPAAAPMLFGTTPHPSRTTHDETTPGDENGDGAGNGHRPLARRGPPSGPGSNHGDAGATAAPEGRRLFGGSSLPTRSSGVADDDAVASPAVGDLTAPADDGTTSAGLTRRVPRAAGANRARPGSDVASRAVTGTQRTPDEVRNMLSRFRTGAESGRAATDQPTTHPDPNEDPTCR